MSEAITKPEATPEVASVAPEVVPAIPRGGPRRAAVIFIFATALMDVISLGIMIPVLPNRVMQFFFGPIVGMLSDRFGRRPVLLISIFGLGVDYMFMALAPTLGWLFVG